MNSTTYTDPLLEAVEHYTNEMDLKFSYVYASDLDPALYRTWTFHRRSDFSSLFEYRLNDEDMFTHLSPFLEPDQISAISDFIEDHKAKHPVGRSGIITCCGINPGPGGTIAIVDLYYRILALRDCSGDAEVDGKIFRELYPEYLPALTCMDKVIAKDKKGPRINFIRGVSNGVWQGILSAHSANYQQVKKHKWLSVLGGEGSLEQRKFDCAKYAFHNADIELETHPGRADAYLLARHAVHLYRDGH